MASSADALMFEVRRLKELDRRHRQISEEAEAEVRDLKWWTKKIADRVEDLHTKLRSAYAQDAPVDDLWQKLEALVRELRQGKNETKPLEE